MNLKGTIMGQQAYAQNSMAPMVDLSKGGQHGAISHFDTYLSSTAYVSRNVIAVLLDAPRGFKLLNTSSNFFCFS